MTSHEYAEKLRELATKLEVVPCFDMPDYQEAYINNNGIENLQYYFDKNRFLVAVRALGQGRKVVNDDDLTFVAINGLLHISVNRNVVCRLVKPAVPAEYDCEPLLSQAEEAQLTTL